MTTICTDGITIAADSLSTNGWERAAMPTVKIVVRYGRIYATAGVTSMRDALIEWHNNGANPASAPSTKDDDGWNMIAIDRQSRTFFSSEATYPMIFEPPFAMGGGKHFSLGAMAAGASPQQAVELAIVRLAHSGPPVQVVDIAEALGSATIRIAAE